VREYVKVSSKIIPGAGLGLHTGIRVRMMTTITAVPLPTRLVARVGLVVTDSALRIGPAVRAYAEKRS